MAVTHLRLLCHAPTPTIRAAAFPSDDDLDEAGRRLLAGAATPRGAAAASVLCSPARAARQTAALLGLEAAEETALRDWDCGRWAGRTLADIETTEPEGLARWLGEPEASPHGGESLAALLRRVGSWLDGLGPGRVVAVTHAAVLRAALVHVLGAPAPAFWRIDAAPLAVARFTGRGGRWTFAGLARLDASGDEI